jgi:ribosome assembly protein YihI (activator of Der GTPase)
MGLEKRGVNSPHWKGNATISGALVNSFRTGARERGIEWKLTADDMARQFEKQGRRCALSGIVLAIRERDYDRTDGCRSHYKGNASLDRIDSGEGYTTSNIQWVDTAINLMKRDMPEEEFIGLCRLIAGRHTRPKETASEFCEGLLSGLWDKRKMEGAYSPHWKGCGAITGTVFLLARVNAETRGIPFGVTCRQLWKKFVEQRGRCAMSGIPLVLRTKNNDTQWNASLDRIDSKKPYVVNNVWWVDQRINLMKRELPLARVQDMCRLVAKHNSGTAQRHARSSRSRSRR